jgi:hypothetical protein
MEITFVKDLIYIMEITVITDSAGSSAIEDFTAFQGIRNFRCRGHHGRISVDIVVKK